MMSPYKRFAAVCLLLLSANNVAFGKIRGTFSIEQQSSSSSLALNEEVLIGSEGVRQLNRHKRMNHNKQGKNRQAADDDDDEDDDDDNYSESGSRSGKKSGKSSKSGKKSSKSGKKGGQSSGSEDTGAKQKGGGKVKGSAAVGPKGGTAVETDSGSSRGKHKTGKKGGMKHNMKMNGKKGNKGGSSDKSADSSDDYLSMPSGKKAKSGSGSGKEYTKSKHKLKKSSQSYEDDDHTGGIEPTLVEIPLTFYFAFESHEDEGEGQARRKLDGHLPVEPTPEEITIFENAATTYATGLFDYLHEGNPGSFYSVTPVIDKVVVTKSAPYPLQVDITFHVLYNEAPEDVPSVDEVAEILTAAFESEEFTYFYMWGRNDIWNNVADVRVEPNYDSLVVMTDVKVLATMLYDVTTDPTTEPTADEYDTLVSLTQSFFMDVLADLYKDDPDTIFETVTATRTAVTFDGNSTPPITVDYSFEVEFDDSSLITPTSEELFQIMAAGDQTDMFESYIRLYLEPSESVWNGVNRVSFLQLFLPPGDVLGDGLIPPASGFIVPGSMIHSFYDGGAVEPTEADLAKAEMVTNAFFMETLTAAYANQTGTDLTSSTTTIVESFFTPEAPQPLHIDYNVAVSFEGIPPTSEEVFQILFDADYMTYITQRLWNEGSPWSEVNGVMYMERIAPPQSQPISP